MTPTRTTATARSSRLRGDDGAVIVEFAIIAPLLLLLVFGIIEFGWLYAQVLNVRHGAREGARLAAVNYNPNNNATANGQAQDIVNAICDRMDVVDDDVTVTLAVTDPVIGNPGGAGRFLRATVAAPAEQVTGIFSPVLNGVTLRSTVEMRIEQRSTWARAINSYTYTGTC